MPTPPQRTALYRLYGADDALLYIGISNDPDFRWKAHLYSDSKNWARLATRHVDQWFETRAKAEAAEVAAIQAEHPRFNGMHNYEQAWFSPAIWSQPIRGRRKCDVISKRIRLELEADHWAAGMRVPSGSQIAAETGASLSTTAKALRPFIQSGTLSVHGGRGVFVNPYAPDRPDPSLRTVA
ncbi:GntR family transcriptional regulator [Streptomyces sp. CFMR 7]|uniref:GntR family transcriptional regulator n=1 Tax=Streptomyces sp. CFMR 7 TaxID=1649184 RepID=UPI00119F984E|nr:GntR family transcriptional regulator [Streptomyces sp. CFMR 7]